MRSSTWIAIRLPPARLARTRPASAASSSSSAVDPCAGRPAMPTDTPSRPFSPGNGELVAAGVREERALGESCGQRPLERPEDRVAGLGAVRRVQRPEAVEVGYGDGDRQGGIEQGGLRGQPVQRQCPRVVGHGSEYGGATYIYEVSIWLALPCWCWSPRRRNS